MTKRIAEITRQTEETDISVKLNIDGIGRSEIEISIGFLRHMLTVFSKLGLFDLKIKANGDTDIDEHHTVEDIGIVMGQAFAKALGDKRGINRYGFFILSMDTVLGTVAVDLSGRYSFTFACDFKREQVGDLATELVYDFWDAFAQNAKISLFIKIENGRNDHHKIETIFKAVAKTIRKAAEFDNRACKQIPSTKGKL